MPSTTVKEHINTLYVTDQERARDFYTDVLGYTLVDDRQVTETFRMIVIAPPGQAENRIALFSADAAGHGVDPDQGAQMAALVENSAFSAGIMQVDDCDAFCRTLKAKNVRFVAEPGPRPWGVNEALILDDSGNRLAVIGPLKE